jgi:hypothetical protein
VGLHYVDGAFLRAVANRPRAMAWSLTRDTTGQAVETAIEPLRPGL